MFPPQMLDELIFVPEVVNVSLTDYLFFPRNPQGTLGDRVVEIQKKNLRMPSKKNVLRTAPVEGLSS